MPNRILREGILTSERVNSLSTNAELFYRRLQSVVDDYGRFSANLTLLRASCYPLKLDSVKEDSISKHLAECVGARLIVLYTVADKAYLELQDFRQQVRAKESKYPAPDKHMHSECVADAKHVQSNAHLGVDVDVDVDDSEPIGSGASPTGEAPQNRSEAIPYQAIVDGYNGNLERLPKVRELTSKRRTALRNAWQANAQRRSLEFWNAYWEECADDPFLNGTGPYKNGHENWRPNFDYLIRGDVVTRVFEKAMDRLEKRA